ncbi:MAG: rhomboid family intramembrane serine protease [Phycisphaerales bacterium]|nr:rhomboid family intramembrane serine protease [Phycisphaerales bacterium]
MGIYDRDYARASGGGMAPPSRSNQGIGGYRPWWRTVNAWLIVLCAAVFAVDGMLVKYAAPVETGLYWVQDGDVWQPVSDAPWYARNLRPDEYQLGSQMLGRKVSVRQPDGSVKSEVIHGLPVFDPNGQVIALAEGTMATPLQRWLHFSSKKVVGGGELWRLIGFQFLHASMAHLLFNMLALFFFGSLVENYLGSKRYLAFYLLCGIAGSMLYLLLNLAGFVWVEHLGLAPLRGLLINATGTPLLGASAGVFGVLIGGAFLAPHAKVLVFFIIPMRLATLAWVMVGVAIVSIFIGTDNAGGEAAHLGGALAGWGFIRHPQRLHRFFDWLGRFDPTSRHFRAPKTLSQVHQDADIDRILAKISRSGLHSLTPAERKALQQASQRGDRRS